MLNEPLVGSNIREARKAKGWSQSQLSREAGISTTALSAYENDKKRPGLDTLASIAHALNTSLDRLYYGDETRSFINAAGSEGRVIVNCIHELWNRNVLNEMSIQIPSRSNNRHMERNMYDEFMSYGTADESSAFPCIVGYSEHITRLIRSLADYKNNEGSYSDPQSYLEQVLESAASNINNEMYEEIPF